MKVGNPDFNEANLPNSEAPITIARAAEMLNVSERSVKSARKVHASGAPELVAAMQAGEVAVSTAADVAGLPKAEQAEIVATGERWQRLIIQSREYIRGGAIGLVAGAAAVRRCAGMWRCGVGEKP